MNTDTPSVGGGIQNGLMTGMLEVGLCSRMLTRAEGTKWSRPMLSGCCLAVGRRLVDVITSGIEFNNA